MTIRSGVGTSVDMAPPWPGQGGHFYRVKTGHFYCRSTAAISVDRRVTGRDDRSDRRPEPTLLRRSAAVDLARACIPGAVVLCATAVARGALPAATAVRRSPGHRRGPVNVPGRTVEVGRRSHSPSRPVAPQPYKALRVPGGCGGPCLTAAFPAGGDGSASPKQPS